MKTPAARPVRLALARASIHNGTPAMPRALEASDGLFDEVKIFCWNRMNYALPRIESQGRTTIERFDRTAPPASLRVLLLLIRYQIWLFWKLVKCRPHVIQVLDAESGVPAVMASLLTRSRLIYDVRDPLPLCYNFPAPVRWLAHAVDWLVMAFSTAFVVPSQWMRSYLGSWGDSGRPVTVVQNTCHDRSAELEGGSTEHQDDVVRIAFLGYLSASRGAAQLMQLCREEAGRVELVVAGECRSAELSNELESTPAVRMLDRLSSLEAMRLMKRSDVVSLLYDPGLPVNRLFASPNKFFEAMMVGTPVLVSKGMSLAQLVEVHGLGYVAEYGNADDLRRAIQQARDADQHARFRRNCREFYLAHCQLSRDLKAYRELYETVLKRCA